MASDGVTLRYRVWTPESPRATMVFLHGLGMDGGAYQAFGRMLAARGYEVVLPDMRGCGASGGSETDVETIGQHSRDVLTLLDHLNSLSCRPMFLGAHSVGCSVLLQTPDAVLDGCEGVALMAPMMSGYPDYARHHTGWDDFVHWVRHWRRGGPDRLTPKQSSVVQIGWRPQGLWLGTWAPSMFGGLRAVWLSRKPSRAGPTAGGRLEFTFRHFTSLRCHNLHRRLSRLRTPVFAAIGQGDEFVQPSAVISLLRWELPPGTAACLNLVPRADHFGVLLAGARLMADWLDLRLRSTQEAAA